VNLLVLDANVAAKWILPRGGEPLVEQALELLHQYERAEVRILVPDLFWSEIANVIWKAVRQERLAASNAHQALLDLRSRRLPTVPAFSLLDQALALAIAFERSVYDSIYLALATESKATLVTADEKLANAVAAKLPVKWLGALY